jgi:hypothetical protein
VRHEIPGAGSDRIRAVPGRREDGSRLLALRFEDQGFPYGKQHPWVYDFNTRAWTKLGDWQINAPCLSADSRYIFAALPTGIGRISTWTQELEVLFQFGKLSLAGGPGNVSPNPDGSFFLLEDIGQEDIYALELELPPD